MDFFETDIPDIFKTYVGEEHFEYCINCGKYLLEEGTHYMIEKAFKDNEVEFEHAICIDCAQNMQTTMSPESMQNIEAFFKGKFNENERMEKLFSEGEPSIERWMNNCIISNDQIDNLKEYQVYAHCNGDKLVYSVTPFIISGKIIEEMSELLSAKTKEELDDYMDKHFNLPPEWKEALKNKKILLI